MNSLPFKQTIKSSLHSFGLYARRLRRDKFPGVLVLAYHGIPDDDLPNGSLPFGNLHVRAGEFEAHCRLLKEFCHPISAEDLRQARNQKRALPDRPVLMTFDDGYRSVYTNASPILKKYGIPAVFFVCSEPVEQRQLLWYDAMAKEFGEAEVENAKYMNFDEWDKRRQELHRNISDDDPCAPMTMAEVKELAEAPGFEIGDHTAFHLILSRVGLEQQRTELARNRAVLESWTGRSLRSFAYPNGRRVDDYSAETVELVKETGFDLAFTTNEGFAHPETNPLELSRFMMLAGISAAELAHRICYSWRK